MAIFILGLSEYNILYQQKKTQIFKLMAIILT